MHLKIQIYDAGSRPAPQPAILAYKMQRLVPIHAPGSPHRFSCKQLSGYLKPGRGALFLANHDDIIVGASVFGQFEPQRAHLVATAVADGVDERIIVPDLTRAVCDYYARRSIALSLVTPRRGDIRQLEFEF